MKLSKSFDIEEKLYKDFLEYCLINNIQDSNDEFIKMFTVGFNITKYGVAPFKPKVVMPVSEKEEIIDTAPQGKSAEVTENKEKTKTKKPKVRIIKN